MQAHAAAQQVTAAVDDDLKFRIDLDPDDELSTRLVQALFRWGTMHQALAVMEEPLVADRGGLGRPDLRTGDRVQLRQPRQLAADQTREMVRAGTGELAPRPVRAAALQA